MPSHINLLLLFSAFSLLNAGCTKYLYAPSTHPMPLFKEAKEVYLTGAFGSFSDGQNTFVANPKSDYVGADGCVAWSPINHLSVLANGFSFKSSKLGGNLNGSYADLGFGTYLFKKLTATSGISVGGYFGSGRGKSHQLFNPYDNFDESGETAAFFKKRYFEPIIGYRSKIFEVGFAARIGRVKFYKTVQSGQNRAMLEQMTALASTSQSRVFEPSFVVRVGCQYVFAQFQYGFSRHNLPFSANSNINVGLCFVPGARWPSKKSGD